MSETSNRIYSASPIPTFSKQSQKALKSMLSAESSSYYSIQEMIDEIESYKRSHLLMDEIEKTPIKAKVLSVLAASLIITLIVGATIGSHYARTLITDVGGKNYAIILGIIVGAVVVTNVVGGYFNHRWQGVEWARTNPDCYAAPIIMSFSGIGFPLWRAFGNNIRKKVKEDFDSVKEKLDVVHRMSIFRSLQSDSAEKQKIKKEWLALDKFFYSEDIQ